MPLRSPRPQPRRPCTASAKANRCVPVRQTFGSASQAAAVWPMPAAIASARTAGSFFGARPESLTWTIVRIARSASASRQRTTAFAFSTVSARSVA